MQSAEARRRLVERLEREVAQAPGRYRLKLALLAGLGYAVLAGALLSTLGLLVFIVGYMLVVRPPADPYIAIPIIVLGMAGTVVLRALWIRFVPPDGHALQPGEAPELRAEVERIRKAVGAAPLHGLVINAELNAAAAYVPHGLGLWRQRHYLILGLPLLHALDRRELAAVIAHEFGHFHGGHGHFTGWIYRLRSSWHRLLDGMATGGMAGGQLLWFFFRWYAPYFDAYSQVLARRQEYAADAVSARVSGTDATASALVRMELVSDWLEGEFWPGVQESARAQAYPPIAVHEHLAQRLSHDIPRNAPVPARLLAREPSPDDTHPTLSRRLTALDAEPRQRDEAAGSRAADMLGELDTRLQQRFSQEWRLAAEPEWKVRHQAVEQAHRRLSELESHSTHTPAEAVERACLSDEHHPGVDAVPLYREALRRAPSNANCHYRFGALLLKRGSESGAMQHLERALELDAALVGPVLRTLGTHARANPDFSALDARIERLRMRYAVRVPDPQDGDADRLEAHALDPAQLQEVARTLRGYDKVRQAWIMRRSVSGVEVMPHFLVLLDWNGSVASERAVLPRIAPQLRLPGSCTVLTTSSDAAQGRAIRLAAEAPAYLRT